MILSLIMQKLYIWKGLLRKEKNRHVYNQYFTIINNNISFFVGFSFPRNLIGGWIRNNGLYHIHIHHLSHHIYLWGCISKSRNRQLNILSIIILLNSIYTWLKFFCWEQLWKGSVLFMT